MKAVQASGCMAGLIAGLLAPIVALAQFNAAKLTAQGLPEAVRDAAPYQHSVCGLDDSPHAATYQRCLAHTGCELVVRNLAACNQLHALMAGLSARVGPQAAITNFDLFEVIQPPVKRGGRLQRYADAASRGTEPVPDSPAWKTLSWGTRDFRDYRQRFTYFEGRASLLPGGKTAKSTGSPIVLGRGVAISLRGELSRGSFKEGELHGLGQTLSVNNVFLLAGRFRHGELMGMYIRHDPVDRSSIEQMAYDTGDLGRNSKDAGVMRTTWESGRSALSLSTGRNDSHHFNDLSGRIDPFKAGGQSSGPQKPQLAGSGAKP